MTRLVPTTAAAAALLLLVVLAAAPAAQAQNRRAASLFSRMKQQQHPEPEQQEQQQQQEEAPAAAEEGGIRFERRRLALDEMPGFESVFDKDLQMMKDIQQGRFDFFGQALPEMLETVTVEEAQAIFDNFKVMKTSQTWKAFEASGDTSEEGRNAAMIKAVQEVGSIITDAKPITESADAVTTYTEEFLKDLKDNDADADSLFAGIKAGDPVAVGKLQQKFADKYFGGLDLETFQDNEWIEKARERFFANDELLRMINDDDILSILKNPELRLYKPSEMGEADPSRLLTSLMGRYAHGEHVNTVGTEGTQVNMNGQAVGGF